MVLVEALLLGRSSIAHLAGGIAAKREVGCRDLLGAIARGHFEFAQQLPRDANARSVFR